MTPINCKLTEVDNLFTESITEDADDGVKESSKHEKPISILDKCNNMIVHSPYQSSILPPEPAKPQPPNFGLELGKSRALLKPRSYKRKRIVVSDDEYCEADRSSSFLPQNDAASPTQAKVCSFGEAPNLSIIVENQKEGHSKKEETRGSSLLKSSLKSEQSPISKRHKGVHFANELEEVFSIVTVPDPAPAPAHNTDRLSIAYSLMNKYNDALEKQVEIVGVEQEDLVTRQPCPPPAVQKSVTKRSCALYINRNFLMKDTRKDQLKRGKIEKYKCRILDYMPTKSLVNGKLSGFDNQAYIVPTTNMKVLPGVLLSLIAKDDEIEIVEVSHLLFCVLSKHLLIN